MALRRDRAEAFRGAELARAASIEPRARARELRELCNPAGDSSERVYALVCFFLGRGVRSPREGSRMRPREEERPRGRPALGGRKAAEFGAGGLQKGCTEMTLF